MAPLDRDNLGWLLPVLGIGLVLGFYIITTYEGSLQQAGIFLFLASAIGLFFSRRIRREVFYRLQPKTPERTEAYQSAIFLSQQIRLIKKAGIPQLITDLYQDSLRHFPEWISEHDEFGPHVVPENVTLAERLSPNRIRIIFNNREYFFRFIQYVYTTPEGERDVQASLEVSKPNGKLLVMHLVPNALAPRGRFRPMRIEYAMMGDWVNDFKSLAEVIAHEKRRRYVEDRME